MEGQNVTIEFTPLTSGLGIRSSITVTQKPIQTKTPPQIFNKTPRPSLTKEKETSFFQRKWLALALDHLLILLCITLCSFLVYWQSNIKTLNEWKALVAQTWILPLYGCLWFTYASFYFMFFKQFKIPSPGKKLL